MVVSCTIDDAIKSAASTFSKAGIEEPRREAALLLTVVLERPLAFLIAHPEYDLPVESAAKFYRLARRRADHEPFHYITGTKEFFGLEFYVGPGVLIPRPETEMLVEEAIRILSSVNSSRFLEIGVGSGCISISVLHALKGARAVGVEISSDALEVADRNSILHRVTDRFEIRRGDLYDGLKGSFDLIVSNPPYIPMGDLSTLQPEVRMFEPHIALFAGDEGLSIIRALIKGATELLKPLGSLLIEIGAGQAERVRWMFDEHDWVEVESIDDLQGIPRVFRATKAGDRRLSADQGWNRP